MDNRGLEKLDQLLLKYGNNDSILSASELYDYFAVMGRSRHHVKLHEIVIEWTCAHLPALSY